MINDLINLLLESRENFDRIEPHLKEHTLSREVLHIISTIREYRKTHPEKDAITVAELQTYHHIAKAARLSSEQNEAFNLYMDTAGKVGKSQTAEDILEYYLKLDVATKVANMAVEIGAGDDTVTLEDIETCIESYTSKRRAVLCAEDLFVDDDLSTLAKRVSSPGLEWRLEELNVGAGPVRAGDMCLVAAAVESGKTTFLADQTSYWATQLEEGETILWCNNEEHSDKVKLRVYQAALARTSTDILSDLNKAKSDYLALYKGEDKIRILQNNSSYNSTSFISQTVARMKPKVVVFDQLDKVKGLDRKGQDEHTRLGKLYNWARDLAMDNDLIVLAASQVDATGFNTKYIHMHQLRGSKVDKPGELDLLVTIGKLADDPKLEMTRFIHLPKNKLHGGPRSDERYRHGYWEVQINPAIARYEGVL